MTAAPAYCMKQGTRKDGRPKCVLLRGHRNECQTEIAPKEVRNG